MSTKIVVPELGESIVEATVSRWLKEEGQAVAVGEAVVELETDKVNLEVSAEQDGVLSRIDRQEGEDVEIGDVLGMIDESAEADTQDEADSEAEDDDRDETAKKEEAADADETEPETQEEKDEAPESGEKATPVARRLAEEHGLDLSQISSEGDRISKEDVERYMEQQKGAAQSEEADSGASTPDEAEKKEKQEKQKERREAETGQEKAPQPGEPSGREERVRMSRRRQTIARRLVEAQQTAAMLTTFNEVDMSAVMALRQRRREAFEERHGVRLGFMSFFVKAAIGALKQFPQLNAEIDGSEIVLKHYYDIGMAVSAEEGLVVPVIREADRLTFAAIEQKIVEFADKAKEGSLSIPDLRGGTFTITNGGVFGSLLSTPILNPPQVAILGLHKIEKRPVVVDDNDEETIAIRPMMYVALSYDHRIVDGAEAVQFLVRIKALIEDPERLLLEG